MYEAHDDASKLHDKLKRRAAAVEAKLLKDAQDQRRGAITYEGVLRGAMQQHMLCLHDGEDTTCFYTAPASCLMLQGVESALSEPGTKRQRIGVDADHAAPLPDIEAMIPRAETVTFQILLKNPQDKKVIRPAVGAGGRLSKGAVVLAHKHLSVENALVAPTALISGTSATADSFSEQFLLSGFAGEIEELQTTMRRWSDVQLAWTFRSTDVLGVQHGEMHSLLQGIVAAGAFASNTESLGYTAMPHEAPSLQLLQDHGLACTKGNQDVRWFLTDAGTKDLTSCARVANPVRVFQVRNQLRLQDRTSYELILALQEAGWQWQAWVPASKRTRRMALAGRTFDAYVRDGQKVWYSTSEPPVLSYMLVLLRAEEIFALGLPAIEHGRDDASYKALLRGDIQAELARLEDAPPPDVDAVHSAEDAPAPLPAPADDVGGAEEAVEHADAQESSEESDAELLELVEEAVEAHHAAIEAAEPADAPVAPPAHSEPEAAAVAVAPEVPPAPRAARAARAPGPAASDEDDDDEDIPQLVNRQYGVFRITAKQPGTVGGGRYGGFQATCVFHKKSDVTGCKRYIGCDSAEASNKAATLRRLLWWCTQARDFDRQRLHVSSPLPLESCPPMSVLEAQVRLMQRPDLADVRSDVELDAAARRAAAAAPAHAAPKAKAKGKAKAKPKGKAKAEAVRAKPKPKSKAAAKAAARAASDHEDSEDDGVASGGDDEMPASSVSSLSTDESSSSDSSSSSSSSSSS